MFGVASDCSTAFDPLSMSVLSALVDWFLLALRHLHTASPNMITTRPTHIGTTITMIFVAENSLAVGTAAVLGSGLAVAGATTGSNGVKVGADVNVLIALIVGVTMIVVIALGTRVISEQLAIPSEPACAGLFCASSSP